jgi:Cu/Ag efflux protein CusF
MVIREVVAAMAFTSAIHGNVVSVDRAHNLVVIHHHAHAGMAMEMTMAVRMADPRALGRLRKGAFVELRCDEDQNPWVCVRR